MTLYWRRFAEPGRARQSALAIYGAGAGGTRRLVACSNE
jgi:hypothetical protein